MAFENVFGNVRFDIPVNQANANRQHFADMLGRGIQQAQFKEQMDLREKQLEQKNSGIKLKQLAEEGALLYEMGQPLSAQHQAAMNAYSKIAPPVFSTDQYGNPVARPSGWSNYRGELSGGMGTPFNPDPAQAPPVPKDIQAQQDSARISNQQLMEMGAQPMGTDQQGNNFAVDVSGDDLFYDVTAQPTDVERMYGQAPTVNTYQAPERFGAMGEVMTEKSKQKFEEERASGALKEFQAMQKQVREAKRPLFEPMEGFTPSAADTKTMTDLTVSKKLLDKQIGDYVSKIDKYGEGGQILGTEAAQDLGLSLGKIRMQIKNLEQLGALQQPDVEAMNAMLGSPFVGESINPVAIKTQLESGGKIAKKGAQDFQSYVNDTLSAQAEARGFKLNIPQEQQKKPAATTNWKEYFQ